MIETFVAALTDAATDDSLRAIHIRGRRRRLLRRGRLGGHQQRRRPTSRAPATSSAGFRTPLIG